MAVLFSAIGEIKVLFEQSPCFSSAARAAEEG
jgi:hypothetical protein